MKYELQGRVVGHSIFFPNPKDYPDLELVKISMSLTPATEDADKNTKAVIVVEKSAAWDDLVLGRVVRITIEDSQQDLFLPNKGKAAKAGPEGSIEFTNPETGEVVKTDLAGLERASKRMQREAAKARSARTNRTH